MGINTLELKAARVRRGLTQRDVADALETVVGNYANKENGRTSMSVEEANHIAGLLALSDAEIVDIFFNNRTSLKV